MQKPNKKQIKYQQDNIDGFDISAVLVDSSRLVADLAVEMVILQPAYFRFFVDGCFTCKYPLSMRSARVVQLCASKNPRLFQPYAAEYLEPFLNSKVDGVRRCFLKVYTESCDISVLDNLGLLIDKAFEWVADAKQPIAIRAFSIDLIMKMIKIEPDLIPEFIALIGHAEMTFGAGMQSKLRKLRKLLK